MRTHTLQEYYLFVGCVSFRQHASFSQERVYVNSTIIIIIIIIVIIIYYYYYCIERRNLRFSIQSPHCAANCLLHVHSSGQGAIVCKLLATYGRSSHATCQVPHAQTIVRAATLTEIEDPDQKLCISPSLTVS